MMRYFVLGLGKILFQVSILIFIIGYCFGFWFKGNNKKYKKPKNIEVIPTTQHAKITRQMAVKAV